MGIFKKRADETDNSIELSEALLSAIMAEDTITRKKAMSVPTFAGCVNKICDTVSMIPIYLYKVSSDSVERVNDKRISLLNEDTLDTLTGADFKKAMVFDYLTGKGGYAYINRRGNKFISLHYVENSQITFQYSEDPIYKDYKINCGGKPYEPYQFIKLLRRTKNGRASVSLIQENRDILLTAYKSLKFEGLLVSKGGNKRGFLEAERKISDEAMSTLKQAFNNLYNNNNENVLVLNDGVKFKETSETSVEMQLNENKKANAVEICKIFGMPPNILQGGATEQDKLAYIQYCIVPILEVFCKSLNRDFLYESEKATMFFAPDIKELTKSDIKARFEAYATAYKTGFMQIDDIRKEENMPALDVPFIKMGLQDVLYNPETGAIFTPNLGKGYNIKDAMDGKASFDLNGEPDNKTLSDNPLNQRETGNSEADGKEESDENSSKS